MKWFLLDLVAKRWSKFGYLKGIKRSGSNELEMLFEGDKVYVVSLAKSQSHIYAAKTSCTHHHKAAFDKALSVRFDHSDIVQVRVLPSDRVLCIAVQKKQAYKSFGSTLRLEFTGRNTNAIILDDKGLVVEALHYVDERVSYRPVIMGEPLADLEPRPIKETPFEIADIDVYLSRAYEDFFAKQCFELRNQVFAKIDKQINLTKALLGDLSSDDQIQDQISLWSQKGNLILQYASSINIYKTPLVLEDIGIDVPTHISSVYALADFCFKKSKKQKAVLKHIGIQRDNLTEKLQCLQRYRALVEGEQDPAQLKALKPLKQKNHKKAFCQEFLFMGWRILVGRNSNENAKLLHHAKKNDLWFHLRDYPSSHVLVVTQKQQVPRAVIEKAAYWCVGVSVKHSGRFMVDYTYRYNVRVQTHSNVLYVGQKSVAVDFELRDHAIPLVNQ